MDDESPASMATANAQERAGGDDARNVAFLRRATVSSVLEPWIMAQ